MGASPTGEPHQFAFVPFADREGGSTTRVLDHAAGSRVVAARVTGTAIPVPAHSTS
jgi:hypothetical protein